MKRTLLFALPALLLFSCNNESSDTQSSSEENTEAKTEIGLDLTDMNLVDLQEEGDLTLKMWVPNENKSGAPTLVQFDDGMMRCEVMAGKNFHLFLSEELGDVEEFKSRPGLFNPELFEVEYYVDDATTLFYTKSNEANNVAPITGFYTLVNIDGFDYVAQTEGDFSKEACEEMLKSVRALESSH